MDTMRIGYPRENLLLLASKLDTLDAHHQVQTQACPFTWAFGFWLRNWTSSDVQSAMPVPPTCGRVGCALGYANLIFRNKRQYDVYADAEYWKEMFGIDSYWYERLFGGGLHWYLPRFMGDERPMVNSEVLPSHVAAGIRHYVKTRVDKEVA